MDLDKEIIATKRWYALMTKARCEYRVAGALERRGFEVFAPSIWYTGVRGNLLEKPFFPRYVFARFNWLDDGDRSIQWTPGVSQIVSFGGQPASLDNEVVTYLRSRLDGLDGDDFLKIAPGSPVRVVSGPFRDYEAIFEAHLNGRERVSILLDMLGQQTRVSLPLKDIDQIAS